MIRKKEKEGGCEDKGSWKTWQKGRNGHAALSSYNQKSPP